MGGSDASKYKPVRVRRERGQDSHGTEVCWVNEHRGVAVSQKTEVFKEILGYWYHESQ